MPGDLKLVIDVDIVDYMEVEHLIGLFEESLAYLFYKKLRFNIRNNTFGYENAKSTLRKKKGSVTVPLIDTGFLLGAITFKDNKVYVKEGMHSWGLTFRELSDILEYGRKDKRIPAFPVWRRTMKNFKKEAQFEWIKFVKKHRKKK